MFPHYSFAMLEPPGIRGKRHFPDCQQLRKVAASMSFWQRWQLAGNFLRFNHINGQVRQPQMGPWSQAFL